MADLDELKARLAAANARKEKATLSQEEIDYAKMLASVEESEAEARASEARRRALRGATLQAEARKVAAGRYLVEAFDLAELLPSVDPEKLPGAGVIVLRSPPPAAVAQFHRELEAKERPLVENYIDLVCASVVSPDVSNHETGMAFRDFIESEIGIGTAITIGDKATTLGGARAKATKRGRA